MQPAIVTPWNTAVIMEVCAECKHTQVSSAVPDGVPDAHRSHPPSTQYVRPRGVSLYPVERTMRSLTTTAPTCRRTHVDRDAARSAILMKYRSHDGRIITSHYVYYVYCVYCVSCVPYITGMGSCCPLTQGTRKTRWTQ